MILPPISFEMPGGLAKSVSDPMPSPKAQFLRWQLYRRSLQKQGK